MVPLILLLTLFARARCEVVIDAPGQADAGGAPVVPVCSRTAEVVFLVDTSVSIEPEEFPYQLQFVSQVVRHLDVSPTSVRVAAISYSRGTRREFSLDRYGTSEDVQRAVERIQFQAGRRTDTHEAFTEATGMLTRRTRDGAVPIIVYITDDVPIDGPRAKEAARQAGRAGIVVFAVAVGSRVNGSDVGELATRNNDLFAFHADSFASLPLLAPFLARRVCAVLAPRVEPVWTCTRRADVVFLVDNIVSDQGFRLQLEVVHDVIGYFDVGPNVTRVGVVTYGRGANKQFSMAYPGMSVGTAQRLVDKISQVRGKRRDSHKGLEEARLILKRHSGDDDDDDDDDDEEEEEEDDDDVTPRIAVYIAHGRASDLELAVEVADKMREEAILVVAVGVGEGADPEELGRIATKANPQFVRTTGDFSNPTPVAFSLARALCAVHN